MPEANISMERRETPRISVKIPVKYRLEDDKEVLKTIKEWRQSEKNAYTLDVSLGGMSIVVDQPLSKGDILCFEIYLLDQKNVVTVYAEVKWTQKKEAGLRFLMMRDNDMEALRAFLGKPSPG